MGFSARYTTARIFARVLAKVDSVVEGCACTMPRYLDIDYYLSRSGRRKTVSIYVERDGSVTVRVPDHLAGAEIEALLEKKRAWIYRAMAEWEDLNGSRVEREFVNGESFPYLGRSYRLKWVDEQEVPLQLKGGYFLLRRDAKTASNPAAAFRAFYREKGRQRIPERLQYFAGQLGVEVKSVRVMELKNRWASLSAKGNLNVHWRCMMAPARVLDYILVHELAHAVVPSHSDAFWREVEKVLPDYRERQEWLRENGAGLDL